MPDCTKPSSKYERISYESSAILCALIGRHAALVIVMVLIYENDPLDNEDARGRFYHVCRGRIVRTEIQLPSGENVYECPVCGIDLEPEDFWIARQKGSV